MTLRFYHDILKPFHIPQSASKPIRFRRYKPVEFPVLERRQVSSGYGCAPVSGAYWNISNHPEYHSDLFTSWANSESFRYKNGVWSRPREMQELLGLQREYNKRKSECIQEPDKKEEDVERRKEWVEKENAMMRDFMMASSTNWEEIGRFPVLEDAEYRQLKEECEGLFKELLPQLEAIKQVAKPGELPPNWGKVL